MKQHESIINQLRKINALINDPNISPHILEIAKNKFEALIEEHNIDINLIHENVLIEYIIEFIDEKERALLLALGHYVGGHVRTYNKLSINKKQFILICTELQYADFEQLRIFYSQKYLQEFEDYIENFASAFIVKNDLINDYSLIEFWELTPDEQKRVMKVLKIAKSLDKHIFTKLIN